MNNEGETTILNSPESLAQNQENNQAVKGDKETESAVSNVPPKPEDETLLWEIEETKKLMIDLIDQLGEEIENGLYQVLIGDDASGRIPALMFHYFLRELCQRRGQPAPKTYFYPATRANDPYAHHIYSDVHKYLEQFRIKDKLKEGGKVLIVTEMIESGSALSPVALYLNELNIPYDIASLSLRGNMSDIQNRLVRESVHFAKENYVPSTTWNHKMAGVKKIKGTRDVMPAKPYFNPEEKRRDKKIFDENQKDFREIVAGRGVKPDWVSEESEDEYNNWAKEFYGKLIRDQYVNYDYKAFKKGRADIKKASHELVEYFLNRNQRPG